MISLFLAAEEINGLGACGPLGGGRVVAEQKYSEGDSDFSAQLTAIRPLDPDVIVVPGY